MKYRSLVPVLLWAMGGPVCAATHAVGSGGGRFVQDAIETVQLDDRAREKLHSPDVHSFIRLSDGVTHYELSGPPDPNAPLVVLVHGVYGPMIAWDKTAEALNRAGFRVLRYDLYGRGFSDRIQGPYNLELFERQLEELLAKLAVREPIDLVGSSMGAVITSTFTARHPEVVHRLALVGPAGFPVTPGPKGARETLSAHNRNYFFAPEKFPDYLARFDFQTHFIGTNDAIHGTEQGVPELVNNLATYDRIGNQHRPVFVAWGENDRTFSFSHHQELLEALGAAVQFLAVPRAGHLPGYERGDLVNPALVKFLRG